jgi:PKD repeat protein
MLNYLIVALIFTSFVFAQSDGELSVRVSPRAGTAPHYVTFEMINFENYNLSYQWNFGDGSMGEGSYVEHTYETPANYQAVLTITNASGESTQTSFDLSVIPAQLDSRPQFDPNTGITTFDLGIEPPTVCLRFVWDLGDGTTAEGVRFQHTYKDLGMYDVSLQVLNECEE